MSDIVVGEAKVLVEIAHRMQTGEFAAEKFRRFMLVVRQVSLSDNRKIFSLISYSASTMRFLFLKFSEFMPKNLFDTFL